MIGTQDRSGRPPLPASARLGAAEAEVSSASSDRSAELGDFGIRQGFRRAMDALYAFCAVVACVSLVLISAIIPWGVYTRYVLNHSASWPEPAAILLSIVLTFFGAAACYRTGVHMRVTVVCDLLRPRWQQATVILAELMVGALSLFMTIWGIGLCETTWNQTIDEFPFLRVGITYLPIPLGGAFTIIFVLERLLIGPPPREAADGHLSTTAE